MADLEALINMELDHQAKAAEAADEVLHSDAFRNWIK